jgi:hypothetical protein
MAFELAQVVAELVVTIRSEVSASKCGSTSIHPPLDNITFKAQQASRPFPSWSLPANSTLTSRSSVRSTLFAPRLCLTLFQTPPFESMQKRALRQTVVAAKFGRSQPARLEFNYKPPYLFTASSLPLRDFLAIRHPHSPAEKPAVE